jgi:hypothetical protein
VGEREIGDDLPRENRIRALRCQVFRVTLQNQNSQCRTAGNRGPSTFCFGLLLPQHVLEVSDVAIDLFQFVLALMTHEQVLLNRRDLGIQ